ncbi:MAG: hypothetical protein FWE10_03305 [Rikenellaceae bacterium]|nr:hypothetical protein [Rikenellaceae bacterium]MCL2693187.1 hypothetical protein [Rikenellaceae bacterium]
MKGDLVSIDGMVVAFGEAGFSPDALLATNFVYQKLHALARRPLHVEWAAEIAERSAESLYGRRAGLTSQSLENEIYALLEANRYPPHGSAFASLYLVPDGEKFIRLLSCERQMVFKGYALTTGVRCLVVSYEPPLAHHKTAASLAMHSYTAGYARRKSFDAALAESAAGVLTGLGEWPVFAIVGDKAFTPSLADGVPDSVERRLGIAACTEAGLIVCEHALTFSDTADYDELFALTPQGITSICQLVRDGRSSRALPHSMAKNVLAHMRTHV